MAQEEGKGLIPYSRSELRADQGQVCVQLELLILENLHTHQILIL